MEKCGLGVTVSGMILCEPGFPMNFDGCKVLSHILVSVEALLFDMVSEKYTGDSKS